MRLFLSALVTAFALTAASLPARADLLVAVDKDAQRMSVLVDGEIRYTWPVSTGIAGHDTPNGSYRPFRMEKTHFSREWDNAPMPHAIFFTQVGHAIHGTTQTRRLGRAASHGCVRLSQRNAATLFALVKQQTMARTRVVIEGSGEAGEGVVAVRSRGRDWEERDFYDAPPRRRYRDAFDGEYGPGVGYGDLY
ncbi:L,D-transpeptidase [Methylorubrum zatmanii]|uniref:L,D-transpeptidase n=1 Tax=Methylorubrum zatmanii TaxID=29429 RepID=A0ABW1WWA8_9HYPH|nr:L,D-transpeptidase [Methylorubrum zatmanii]MBD8905661.1 L,D-transpeptidase [Methylorubrum zatmanii]